METVYKTRLMKPKMLGNLFEIKGFAQQILFENNAHPWDALKGVKQLLENYLHAIHTSVENVFIENKEMVSIGEGTKIGPCVCIEGPVIIGENCDIRHGAYIRPGTIISDNCVIGHASEVVRSIVLPGAKLPHFNYVGDSIIGKGVNLGAGVRIANLRLDEKEIIIHFEGERIRTGLKKFGALVGDGAMIGCNAVLNPGTIIQPHARVAPGVVVGGVVLC